MQGDGEGDEAEDAYGSVRESQGLRRHGQAEEGGASRPGVGR